MITILTILKISRYFIIIFLPQLPMSDSPYILPWLDILYGTLESLAILVGLTLNSLALRYFYKRRHQLSNLLFLLITVNDLVILTSCIPTAVSMLSNRNAVLFNYRGVCILAGFLFNISSRMSVFLIALLALARSISLLFPFRLRRNRVVYLLPLCIYLFLNLLLASLPLIFSKKMYYFHSISAACSWGVNDLSFVGGEVGRNYTTAWYGMTYSTIIIPWFAPAVIVLVSFAFSLHSLLKSGRQRRKMTVGQNQELDREASKNLTGSGTGSSRNGNHGNAMRSTNHATMTIVIATSVYVIFNVPGWMMNVIMLLSLRDQNFNTFFSGFSGIYLGYFMTYLSVVLNSASNSLIYFSRMDLLRKENGEMFCWILSRIKVTVRGCGRKSKSNSP